MVDLGSGFATAQDQLMHALAARHALHAAPKDRGGLRRRPQRSGDDDDHHGRGNKRDSRHTRRIGLTARGKSDRVSHGQGMDC